MNASEAVTKARTRLLIQQPFFGALALRLRPEASSQCKTLQTDGRVLRFNPQFVESLPFEDLVGAVAHEVMHCALQHPFRRGARDQKLWNRACDYAVNPMIMEAGFSLPAGVLNDPAHAGKSAEEIYRDLQQGQQPPQSQSGKGKQKPQNGQQQGQGSGQGNGQPNGQQSSQGQASGQQSGNPGGIDGSEIGEVIDATDESTGKPLEPAQAQAQAHEWRIAAEQAAQSAKVSGKVPGGFARTLEAIREARVDWRAVLRRFIAQTVISDYTWSRPNRRLAGQGLYLPSTSKEGCGELVIAIDTSGSLSAAALSEFAAEVQSIADDVKPEAIHVIYCDAAINDVRTFRQFEPVELEMKGGGGTDFRPPFAWVESEGIRPKAMLYLTDLCCYSYPDEPDFPVLWVTQSRDTAPWGETVRMEPEAA